MNQHDCNQAVRLNKCLCKVQQGMQLQLKVLQSEQTKGKSAGKVGAATEEHKYLMNFNTSITQCMAKAMEHFFDFTFVSMTNVTLVRWDSYLAHVKSGLKQDTLAALCQAPLDSPTLFPDSVLRNAEEDIEKFERGHGGRVVTLSPPTSEAGVRFPARPHVGKLVVYSTEP